MTNPNDLFKHHVTGMAFNLSLSKNMIAMLALVASENNPENDEKAARADNSKWHEMHNIYRAAIGRDDTVGSGNALLRRGLIYSPYPKWPGIFCLTEAGRHVFQLCCIAGLIERVGVADLGFAETETEGEK